MANAIELARLWVVKGTNDLLCADNNLQAKQIPFDTVCFHCQQAAEKFLVSVHGILGAERRKPPADWQ